MFEEKAVKSGSSKEGAEVLSPCGKKETVEAAVRSGADAIYVGFRKYSARGNAENFDEDDLLRAVSYCHSRGVKVYLALNTVVFEEELEEVRDVTKKAAECGVDAVIVQDLGVARMIRGMIPGMALHASTQMTVHNIEGVKALESIGFKRVVLSRELSREEIVRIRKNCGCELEVFVHGALCMSISGQCYMSAMIGGRSGNRGECAQPCRLEFSRKGMTHALSLKDLSLIDRVDEMRDIGIDSLKIEGRMKRSEYVAGATSAVRSMLDNGDVSCELISDLEDVFSRSGFTRGYYDGVMGEHMFGIRRKEDVISATSKVLKRLSNLYKDERMAVKVRMFFSWKVGERAALRVSDGVNEIRVESGTSVISSGNSGVDGNRIKELLSQTGGTPFKAESIEVDVESGGKLSVSEIKGMRRRCLEGLLAKRGEVIPRSVEEWNPDFGKKASKSKAAVKLRGRFRHIGQMNERVCKIPDDFMLPLDEIVRNFERLEGLRERLICELPRVWFDVDRNKLEEVFRMGCNRVWVGNIGLIPLCKDIGFEMIGGYSLNVCNSIALSEYRKLGLSECELSPEVRLSTARKIGVDGVSMGGLVYGKLPMMLTRNCPLGMRDCKGCKGSGGKLRDRKGMEFGVSCTGYGTFEVHNCHTLYLADKISEFKFLDFQVLYFTDEKVGEVENIIDEYRANGGCGVVKSKITRGIYYR